MEEVKEVALAFTRRYTLTEHTCPVCGSVFQGPRLRVYCGEACRKKAAWKLNGKKYNANRKRKEG